MKTKSILFILCSFLFLSDCITKYEATGIEEMTDILVVEGIITDYETIITLSRSMNLTGEYDYSRSYYVDNAEVYVECDDGMQFHAEPYDYWGWGVPPRNGRYLIKTGALNPDLKYSLKIEIDEIDGDCIPNLWGVGACPTKTYEYYSDFSYPMKTPEIDSIFWIKRGKGQPVMLYVATHELEQKVSYYRWSYREDWEVNAELYHADYPRYCWKSSRSSDFLLGTDEKTVYGQLADILTEIAPSDDRLSDLYRIIIKQNVISKRAHDYYLNIKKNAENMGSLFAPVPSELRGNIVCITDPQRPVIGYIDVSSTTNNQRFISRSDNLYEPPYRDCGIYSYSELRGEFGVPVGVPWNPPRPPYIMYSGGEDPQYVLIQCVDCRELNGTLQKPDDWPNNYY